MPTKLLSFAFLLLLFFASGCANILSKSSYPLYIHSQPSQAKITVTNQSGTEVYKGTTPARCFLEAGNKFFSKAQYYVKIEKEGYEPQITPVQFVLDPVYLVNIPLVSFGGIIGLLIVDPATGAMFKIKDEFIDAKLTQSTTSAVGNELRIETLDQIPLQWRAHLVEIKAYADTE